MVASPPLTTRVRLLIALSLLGSGAARAEPTLNGISRLVVHEDGATTTVAIRGSTTPTFTVYKLERPERVVVDVANARLAGEVEPMAVNSWAVGQVTAQALGGEEAVVRVLVGFARPSEYHVKAVGKDVVVTVVAREPKPADTVGPALAEAEARRAAAEQAAAQAEAKRRAAEAAAADAAARAKASEAAGAADAAKRRREAEDA